MKFYELVKSENTDSQFERWTVYRENLTSMIEELLDNYGADVRQTTLAVWGAGGCNDIDIGRLSSKAKLVLIDCEKNRTKAAIERYDLDKTRAIDADLFFYDIPHINYEEWERLLECGEQVERLHGFLSDVFLEAISSDMLMLPEFDYSVAVGISSQLNSRFAALLYNYRNNYSVEEGEDILRHLAFMDKKAAERLYEAVHKTTSKNIIWGFEYSVIETGEKLNIEGNKRIMELILSREDSEGKDMSVEKKRLVWPFLEGKSYNMNFFVEDSYEL